MPCRDIASSHTYTHSFARVEKTAAVKMPPPPPPPPPIHLWSITGGGQTRHDELH